DACHHADHGRLEHCEAEGRTVQRLQPRFNRTQGPTVLPPDYLLGRQEHAQPVPLRRRAREYGSLAPALDVGVRPPGRDGQNARADHAAIASDVRLPLPDGLEPPYRPVHGETDAPDRRRLARNGKEACGSEPASKAELVGTSCGTRGRTAHEIP